MPDRYETLAAQVRKDYPRFNVKKRDKSWLGPLFWLLKKITGQDYKTFTTTVFSTMYVGPLWEKKSSNEKYKTLRHELVHIRQNHEILLPRFLWPINHLIMGFCYIMVLPIFLTMRAKLEREGYTQTMLVHFELEGPFSEREMESWARWMAKTFSTGVYFWMWRSKPAYEWAMDTMRKINAGEIVNSLGKVAWALPVPEDRDAE